MSDTLATLNRIKALEQAHAELAAKVEQQTDWIAAIIKRVDPTPIRLPDVPGLRWHL